MLGGRDALAIRGEVHPLVLAVQVGTLRDEEPVLDGIVERRQFMHIALVGFLAPTECRLRPQFLLKVMFVPIELDNRRTIFDRGADKGVLVELRDSRLKRPLHRNGHSLPFATLDFPWDELRRG
jgi:hypothetical protein